MKSPWTIQGSKAITTVLMAALALSAIAFLAAPVMPAEWVQQMTMTSSMGMMSTTGMMSDTQMMTTTTSTSVAPIPGFPVGSIFLGLLLGVVVLMIIRTRRKSGQDTDEAPS